ncbi:hypothetical protein S7335_536 [Synechococcus sp. PCC 7335]|uniref:hypothetical protein n=1 Tax=Synechococcus sp. (strain ATCC 29403 / PCC 7335) TaxID=91464 RepID=UPI00017EBCAA|nr:hypothetical protein [Synechococcus sp. PCC 7335]EDX83046.1 hypothetical protein S7335_224 [Synechococcus sp. PCC 7335]EDX83356.1 hypothetical protein S7335_536 [Synechococcus sp. PCC 7335]
MTLKKFEKIATASPFVEYFGTFNGRGSHEGIAVTAEGPYEYAQFCLELMSEGLCRIAEERPLIDQWGLSQIYSWPKKLIGGDRQCSTGG